MGHLFPGIRRQYCSDLAAPGKKNAYTPESLIIHQETIQVERKIQNRFSRYTLLLPVTGSPEFFVSWKQITNASIPVGLDKNNDNVMAAIRFGRNLGSKQCQTVREPYAPGLGMETDQVR